MTGGVAIQRDDRFWINAPEHLQLVFGDGRPQWGHRRLKARTVQRNDIHVAFGHQQRLALARRGARLFHVVEAAALVKKLRLGRVEVFGIVIRVHRPPAKGNRPPARVPDREHDAAPEGVIGFAPVAGWFSQASRQDHLIGNVLAFQRIPKPLPTVRGKADFPMILRSL